MELNPLLTHKLCPKLLKKSIQDYEDNLFMHVCFCFAIVCSEW